MKVNLRRALSVAAAVMCAVTGTTVGFATSVLADGIAASTGTEAAVETTPHEMGRHCEEVINDNGLIIIDWKAACKECCVDHGMTGGDVTLCQHSCENPVSETEPETEVE